MAVRALLLTDVVDSTKLAEQLGDAAMAARWARHDRVAPDLLVDHRGREIDKTDGFLLIFERADDALAYAIAYHAAIAGLGLQARAGLHVGDVILTENAPEDVARGAKPLEVDGVAKPYAARVMGVAIGGQTLVTAEAMGAVSTAGLAVASHGFWRLKGLDAPVELFEVGAPGVAPLRPPGRAEGVARGGPRRAVGARPRRAARAPGRARRLRGAGRRPAAPVAPARRGAPGDGARHRWVRKDAPRGG